MLIRHRFDDYTGAYVIHCHFLGHEDRGMMWNVQTVCSAQPAVEVRHHPNQRRAGRLPGSEAVGRAARVLHGRRDDGLLTADAADPAKLAGPPAGRVSARRVHLERESGLRGGRRVGAGPPRPRPSRERTDRRNGRTMMLARTVTTRLPTDFGEFRLHAYSRRRRRQPPPRPGQGRRRPAARSPGAHPFRVPHRRGLLLAAVRLRHPARSVAGGDRAGAVGGADLPAPGGAGDRPAQQAPRLRAPGRRPRHRRRQPPPRLRRRPARLRGGDRHSRRPRA